MDRPTKPACRRVTIASINGVDLRVPEDVEDGRCRRRACDGSPDWSRSPPARRCRCA
jgi:hypothetical protein